MRSAEEIKEFATKSAGASIYSGRDLCYSHYYAGKRDAYWAVIEFSESEPPCKHPHCHFRDEVKDMTWNLKAGWVLEGAGCLVDLPVKFCPDCGAELKNPPA